MQKTIAYLGRAARAAPGRARQVAPGLGVAAVLAVTSRFLSEHYGAPAMLMALLLGIAFHFLAEEGRCVAGIDFGARTVLRAGVALLGARISVQVIADLGLPLIGLVVGGVIATIGFALVASRLLGRGWRFALLTGGAVAICGASAAMAVAAVLPRGPHSERDLIFTVAGVTLLSTAAMILYPLVADMAALSPGATGVFLGATIHDVAQVVGAGFSVSEPVGETATLVKLIRVAMLAPVVLVVAVAIPIDRARRGGARAAPAARAGLRRGVPGPRGRELGGAGAGRRGRRAARPEWLGAARRGGRGGHEDVAALDVRRGRAGGRADRRRDGVHRGVRPRRPGLARRDVTAGVVA